MYWEIKTILICHCCKVHKFNQFLWSTNLYKYFYLNKSYERIFKINSDIQPIDEDTNKQNMKDKHIILTHIASDMTGFLIVPHKSQMIPNNCQNVQNNL